MPDRVLVDICDGLAHVRLNRPDKLNSLDPEMISAIVDAGKRLASDSSVRAVALTGEGRAFCSGLDFGSFKRMQSAESSGSNEGSVVTDGEASDKDPGNLAQMTAHVWTQVPVPVIAGIHGYAFGGGLQIALGADIRLVAKSAKLSIMEIKWGLIPDMTGPQRLTRLLRLDQAKELTFTGRVVEGQEAVELGLATKVVDDPVAAALEMAREITTKSPHAIRSAKRIFDATTELDLEEGLQLEERLQRDLIGTANQVEAVTANFEERTPVFADV